MRMAPLIADVGNPTLVKEDGRCFLRRELEHHSTGAAARCKAAPSGGAVEVSGRVADHASFRDKPVRSPGEAVQNSFIAGAIQLEHHPALAKLGDIVPAVISSAVKVTCRIADEASVVGRAAPVRSACKSV